MSESKQETKQIVTIKAPNFATSLFVICGTAPYVQHKFSQKAQTKIRATQSEGSTAKKGAKREPRNFDADYEAAKYVSEGGWNGIPASAFRNAMISACRTVGYQMTRAKLAVFIEADGFDREDKTPLVKITEGKPEKFEAMARNDNGSADIRVRPLWAPGWRAELRVRFDADMFTPQDIANLLLRVGQQVGIGEGRPDSKNSAGLGWGLFNLVNEEA